MKIINKYAFILLTLAITSGNLHAQAGSLVKSMAKEITEYLTKKSGGAAAKEFAEIGGEKALIEVLEKCAKEGGEELTQQVVSHTKAYGPSFLKAIKPDPVFFAKSFQKIPKVHAKAAILELSSDATLMKQLIKSHGDEALEVAAMHPGVGAKVISRYGSAGVNAGKQLPTPDVITLSQVKGFDKLPEASKSKFLKMLDAEPKQLIKALAIVGGGAALILTVDKVNDIANILIGSKDAPGQLISTANKFLWGFSILIILSLATWLFIRLRKSWIVSNQKIKQANQDAKGE